MFINGEALECRLQRTAMKPRVRMSQPVSGGQRMESHDMKNWYCENERGINII